MKLERCEDSVTGPLFTIEEGIQKHKGWWLCARRYSVSKLAIAISDFVFLLWLGLSSTQLLRILGLGPSLHSYRRQGAIAFLILTMAYVALLLWKAKSSPRADAQAPR